MDVLPDALPSFLAGLESDWAGLSLTMPLKQTVLPLLDKACDLTVATGAANTVVLTGRRRCGYNTDVHGIVAALAEAGVRQVNHGIVLGAGATAASALAGLAQLGERNPGVLVRNPARAVAVEQAARRLGTTCRIGLLPGADARAGGTVDVDIAEVDVVISTIPSSGADAAVALAKGWPSARTTLLDVAYHPWPTPLAQMWPGPVLGGTVMLLHQAARQVQLMTGHDAPLEQMRAALPR